MRISDWSSDVCSSDLHMRATVNLCARSDQNHAARFWTHRLLEDGYVIIPDAVDPSLLDALYEDLDPSFRAASFCNGSFYGAETKRFARILRRSPHAAAFAQHQQIGRAHV